MADNNKVRFGISNMHIAFFSEDSKPVAPKWDAPIRIPGVVGFTPDPQSEEYKFYADDIAYFSNYSSGSYSADLETALIPDKVLAEMHGWILDNMGGLLEVQGGVKKDFALMGQMDGDKSPRRFVYYNCTGGIPAEAGTTKAKSIEVKTQKMPMIMNPIEVRTGVLATKYTLPLDSTATGNKKVFDDFYKAVYITSASPDEPKEPEEVEA